MTAIRCTAISIAMPHNNRFGLREFFMNQHAASRQIDFFQRFVDKYYMRQPKSIRSIVFLLITLTLLYGFYRIVGGEFSVGGQIFVVERGRDVTPAKNLSVWVGDRGYGTNTLGFYYVVLTPFRYFSLFTSGSLEVRITQDTDEGLRRPARIHKAN